MIPLRNDTSTHNITLPPHTLTINGILHITYKQKTTSIEIRKAQVMFIARGRCFFSRQQQQQQTQI